MTEQNSEQKKESQIPECPHERLCDGNEVDTLGLISLLKKPSAEDIDFYGQVFYESTLIGKNMSWEQFKKVKPEGKFFFTGGVSRVLATLAVKFGIIEVPVQGKIEEMADDTHRNNWLSM